MRMLTKNGIFLAMSFAIALAVASCSTLTSQETSVSNIPSAANLKGMCAAGMAKVPSVRVGACDDFNLIQTACLGLTNQPLVPAQSLQVCTANGYQITGTFSPL